MLALITDEFLYLSTVDTLGLVVLGPGVRPLLFRRFTLALPPVITVKKCPCIWKTKSPLCLLTAAGLGKHTGTLM